MASLGCGGLNQIVYQPQGVFFIPDIPERIISIALLQVHQIQDSDVIAVLLQPAARSKQDLGFRVRDNIVCVRFQNVWLHV